MQPVPVSITYGTTSSVEGPLSFVIQRVSRLGRANRIYIPIPKPVVAVIGKKTTYQVILIAIGSVHA